MRSSCSSKYIIVVFLAFLGLGFLFGLSAADGLELSPTPIKSNTDYAVYMPVIANRLDVKLAGRLRAADVCADCCSLITLKTYDSVYELISGESYTQDLALYHDFLVQIRGENNGFCWMNGRPIVNVSDVWAIPPFPSD
jgi:hypothetical protein